MAALRLLSTQAARGQLFRQLHLQPDVLVLPSIWDIGSAALLAHTPGVRTLTTTSTGMAAAQDSRVADAVVSIAEAAAGCLAVPTVVHARTDACRCQARPPQQRLRQAFRRLCLYAQAGADCVCVPGFPGSDVDAARGATLIRELVGELGDRELLQAGGDRSGRRRGTQGGRPTLWRAHADGAGGPRPHRAHWGGRPPISPSRWRWKAVWRPPAGSPAVASHDPRRQME